MSKVQKCTTWKDNRFSIWYIDNENEDIKCAKIIIPRPSLTFVDGEYVGGKMMGVNKLMLSHASMYGGGLDGPIDGDILTASTTSHMGKKNKNFHPINFFFF